MQKDDHVDMGSISILIPSIKAGDELARDELMKLLMSHLENSASRNMGQALRTKAGESDIVQQSFIQIIEKFNSFRGKTKTELFAWIETIVINEVRNTNRSFRTQKRDMSRENSLNANSSFSNSILPADTQLTPSSEAIGRERRERISKALDELSPEHAEVIRLRNLQSMQFKEIGERMNRTEEAASQLWYRAMLKFESKLREYGDLED